LKPDFDHAELVNFHAEQESQRIDVIKDKSLADSLFQAADGWYKINISLSIPFECVKHSSISVTVMSRLLDSYFNSMSHQ
jgi:hypothetical protein